jgi:hypothetical protein
MSVDKPAPHISFIAAGLMNRAEDISVYLPSCLHAYLSPYIIFQDYSLDFNES